MVLTVWMYPTLLHLGSMCIQATCIPFWRHDASLKTVENLIKKNSQKIQDGLLPSSPLGVQLQVSQVLQVMGDRLYRLHPGYTGYMGHVTCVTCRP